MGRTRIVEALILKAYDIGDADRLCVLLTRSEGRLAVAAKGVRRAKSRSSGAVQSFQHVRLELAEHSSGLYLRSAECLSPFMALRNDPRCFAAASQGSELLLRFLHDTDPHESLFLLALAYFRCCDAGPTPLLLPTFQLSLLRELGLLPTFASSFDSSPLSSSLRAYLTSRQSLTERAVANISPTDQRVLDALCRQLLSYHLSAPLRSTASAAALSK